MYTNQLSNLQVARGTNARQEYKTEIAVNRQDSINKPNDALIYGGSFSLFAIVTGTAIWLAKRRIDGKKESFLNFDRFKQVPCKNCRYFTGNFYLKCAVHPSEVLTKQAINCSDYWPYEQNNSKGEG